MKAICISQTGGPEVLKYINIPVPEISSSEVLLKIEAIGINFIDTYHRAGLYPIKLPFIPGLEAAGVVEQIGHKVKDINIGDRVAYNGIPNSYAEYVTAPESKLVKLPKEINNQIGAAMMLQGMTAHYLTHSTYPIKETDTVLIHAAAGGVGLLLVQMAKASGAKVFGTVSTPDKANIAWDAGADKVIIYTKQNFGKEVNRFTNDRGVDVVYDGVGLSTYEQSLTSLRTRGTLVLFGQSSGPVPPINPRILSQTGSLYLTRPTLIDYSATREEFHQRANDMFELVQSGRLKIRIDKTLPFSKATEAHQLLEERRTSGKLLLIP